MLCCPKCSAEILDSQAPSCWNCECGFGFASPFRPVPHVAGTFLLSAEKIAQPATQVQPGWQQTVSKLLLIPGYVLLTLAFLILGFVWVSSKGPSSALGVALVVIPLILLAGVLLMIGYAFKPVPSED
jgi:hypothetical protein